VTALIAESEEAERVIGGLKDAKALSRNACAIFEIHGNRERAINVVSE
jgi:hypothetical protein